MVKAQINTTEQRRAFSGNSRFTRAGSEADARSKLLPSEGRLYLTASSLCGFELEIARFRGICPHVAVQTNAQSILDFCDGEVPTAIVILAPSGAASAGFVPDSANIYGNRLDVARKVRPFGGENGGAFATVALAEELSKEIDRRSLPVSLAVYMRRATVEDVAAYFRSGASNFFSPKEADDVWKTGVRRLWSRWKERLGPLAKRRNLKSAFDRLSPPLQDTAKMLYMGCTNQEIAQASGRKLRTIEQRRARIMDALQANNYAELIRYLSLVLENGLTDLQNSSALHTG